MRTLLVPLAVLLVIGCKGGPEVRVKQVPDEVPAGWTLATNEDGTVKIGVPPGWRYGVDRMDMMPGFGSGFGEGFGDGSTDAGQLPPDVQQMMQQGQQEANEQEKAELAEMAAKGIVMNVITAGTRPVIGEARTRYYVKKTSEGGSMSLEEAAGIERQHYARKPKYDTIQLPIGEAIRCAMTDELRDGGVRHQISYVVVDGGDMYSLRFVTQESKQVIDGVAEQVAQTWRITPAAAPK